MKQEALKWLVCLLACPTGWILEPLERPNLGTIQLQLFSFRSPQQALDIGAADPRRWGILDAKEGPWDSL